MSSRLSRAEQNERNSTLLLAAARRVFLAHGYHGAKLEQIAEEAGFSTGAVYSRFDGKADLFLALLEQRITERAAENARLVEGMSGAQGLMALRQNAARRDRAELDWGLLLIEFRVHAARHPALNRRYAAAHARTVQALTDLIAALYERAGQPPPAPPAQLAQLILTFAVGSRLEQAAHPEGSGPPAVSDLLGRLIEPQAPAGDAGPEAGAPT
jgi:AcrR family transcriptional regulator